mmetsp:Transcript_67991/g.167958  ORF Transcript_67991/g.167958 Transcript_67991/m.167958 type:complete len:84 (+) Transcript_67991:558-809(+)
MLGTTVGQVDSCSPETCARLPQRMVRELLPAEEAAGVGMAPQELGRNADTEPANVTCERICSIGIVKAGRGWRKGAAEAARCC